MTELGGTEPVDPAGRAADIRVLRDVVFVERTGYRPLSLDLHLPEADPAPVILFVHGGGWRRGSRRVFVPGIPDCSSFGRITAAGFAVASVDYRLSGEAVFPAQLDDVLAAVDWLRREGSVYGLDAERIVLWGESSGAHLAALAGLRGTAGIAGVVDWYGPADLTRLGAHLDPEDPGAFNNAADTREAELLGAPVGSVPEAACAASPALQVRHDAPPFLIAHGAADDLVPCAQSVELAEALQRNGAEVELTLVEGAGHFWRGVADTAPLFGHALEFALRVTAPRTATAH